jgi:hypothetical protein
MTRTRRSRLGQRQDVITTSVVRTCAPTLMGYVLLQQTAKSQNMIPTYFDVGQHLRLQARPVSTFPPATATKDKPIEKQGRAPKPRPQLQGNTSSAPRSDNGRKLNKRGRRKNHSEDMEGVEATSTNTKASATGTVPTDTNNTGTNPTGADTTGTPPVKASSHIRFTDPEESGNVASTQKTPPGVSLGTEQPPHNPSVKQPGSHLVSTEKGSVRTARTRMTNP